MIAAALIAASVLAPAGVTAGIQGGPACLPVTAQPGHSYPLTVYVQGGSLLLSIGPPHGSLYRSLRQVPSSWVSFSSNPGSGQVALTLAIPSGAAPGAYWSDITGTTQTQPEPGQVTTGAAATAPIVFTVGPSGTPPPPCDALTLAYSTGRFPAWPTKAFATSSWTQVYARDEGGPVTPDGGPTASVPVPDLRAVPAVTYSPAASAGKGSPKAAAGWLVLIGLALAVAAWRRKRKRS